MTEKEFGMPDDGPVRINVHDGIATVRLARPEKLNALNGKMRSVLRALFAELAGRHDIRAVAVLGEGRAFCAGQDLGEKGGRAGSPLDSFADEVRGDFLDELCRLGKPSIVGVQGYCLGRGLMLALSCSIRIAAESASFGYPELELGLLPGALGMQKLVETVGVSRALDMVLTGSRLDAHAALATGLVTRVVADSELEQTVEQTARVIADRPAALIETAMTAVTLARSLDTHEGTVLGKALSALVAASATGLKGLGGGVPGES